MNIYHIVQSSVFGGIQTDVTQPFDIDHMKAGLIGTSAVVETHGDVTTIFELMDSGDDVTTVFSLITVH